MPSLALRGTILAALVFIDLGCRPQRVQLSSGIPALSAAPSVALTGDGGVYALDFGTVAIGEDVPAALTLANSGGSPLTVTQITPPSDGEFTLDFGGNLTIPSGGAVPLTAHYRPLAVGRHSFTLNCSTDSQAIPQLTIVLSGEGEKSALEVSPRSLDFGGVIVHTTVELALTVTNQSPFALTITPQPVQGAALSLFSTDTTTPFVLQPGAAAQIDVTYAPLVASPDDSAVLPLAASEGDGLSVNLHGVALQTGLLVTPQILDFNFVAPGQRTQKTVQVKNIGNTSITLLAVVLYGDGTNPAVYSVPPGLPGGASSEKTLAPGDELDVRVTFAPRSIGFYAGKLQVTALDLGGTRTIPIQGFGGGAAITCAPLSLDFGAVAAGLTTTLPVVCTNTGTDVVGHPEAGLTITRLVSSNPSFTAQIDALSPALPLAAGASLVIDIVYAPTDAEQDTGTLTVQSNIENGSPAPQIALNGSAIATGPCAFTVSPVSLNWGQTPLNVAATLAVTLNNLGPSACYLWNIAFAPSSDSAFLRPGAPPPTAMLGAPDGSLPSTLLLPVTFEAEQAGTYSGELTFEISDPNAPNQVIPLAAVAATSCLTLTPLTLDFGTVGFSHGHLCQSARRTLVAHNGCASAATIQAIDASSPFVDLSSPDLPLSLPPGASGQLTLGFQPNAAGSYYATASVSTDTQAFPSTVFLRGNATNSDQQIDVFPLRSKVDVLWVMDLDDDQYPFFLEGTQISEFVNRSIGFDYQIGVISTDTCAGSGQGKLEPCPTCYVDGNAATIVRPSDDQPSVVLTKLVTQMIGAGGIWNCNGITQDEQFFDSIYLALQTQTAAGYNSGFLRSDAALAILLINADSEDDYSAMSVNWYLNFFQSLKSDPSQVILYALHEYPAVDTDPTPRIDEAVTATAGGTVLLNENPEWASALNLWKDVASHLTTLVLSGQPIAGTVAVYLGGPPPGPGVLSPGVPVPVQNPDGTTNWTYDASINAVDVNIALAAAAPGEMLYVAYTLSCN